MPILSVLATLLKSRFFVIYYRCVTLADGMGGRRDQGPALHSPAEHNPRAGVYSRHKLCYNRITIRDCHGQQAALAMTMGEICYEKDTVRLPWHYLN